MVCELSQQITTLYYGGLMKKQYQKNLKGLEGRKVRVYRNLTHKCFSVKCMETNRVVAHVQEVTLGDATFPVSESQRQEVIRSGHKNVHAFVEGFVLDSYILERRRAITYNPRKKGYFYYKSNGREIKNAGVVEMTMKGLYVS